MTDKQLSRAKTDDQMIREFAGSLPGPAGDPGNDAVLESVADAARALGVGMTTTWGLIRDGHLETVKIGRRTLVKRSSRKRLAENGTS